MKTGDGEGGAISKYDKSVDKDPIGFGNSNIKVKKCLPRSKKLQGKNISVNRSKDLKET